MKEKGINGEATKRMNRLLVLRLLCTVPGLSRTEITRRTGLAKMTVTNITADLIAHRVVQETVPLNNGRTGAGRKQMALQLSGGAPCVLGIWLSRDGCQGVAVTPELKELAQREFRFAGRETADTILEKLTWLCQRLLADAGRPVSGVGIAAVGPLDIREGVILNPPNFFGIRDFALAKLLSQRLGLPVFLQNDMNAAALAEKYYGLGQNVRNFAYVGITNGIGAGIVLDDKLFEGTRGFSGELGHVVIDSSGELCHCGNRGCLETFVSVPRVLERFSKRLGRPFTTVEEVCCLSEQDQAAGALLEEICGELATALVSFCNLFDPELLLIGHDGAALSDGQLRWLEEMVNQRILAGRFAGLRILRSSFGRMAPVYGAAVTVLKKIFDGEFLYEELFSE